LYAALAFELFHFSSLLLLLHKPQAKSTVNDQSSQLLEKKASITAHHRLICIVDML
jgi:hypothetical protein